MCAALATSCLASSLQAQETPEEPKPPLFEGPRELTIHTKEAGVEGSAARLGDGTRTVCGGGFLGAFYTRWFSILGGGTFCPDWGSIRQTYDTRAVARFIYPAPLLGPLFFYAGVGVTAFFHQGPDDPGYQRSFGPVMAVGTFANVTERIRLRVEVRDEWLVTAPGAGMRQNLFGTLSFVTLYR